MRESTPFAASRAALTAVVVVLPSRGLQETPKILICLGTLAFADAGGGHFDELGLRTQRFDVSGSAVSHTCPEPADELVDVSG